MQDKPNIILTVERYSFKEDWTIGKLYFQDRLLGYVIEDELRDIKVHGETAIPVGVYPLDTRFSPKFSRHFKYSANKEKLIDSRLAYNYSPEDYQLIDHQLIWIKEVPNFKYILIHWGNTDDNTDGCLIVGNKIGVIGNQEAVLNSRFTYAQIYPMIFKEIQKGNCAIEIKNILNDNDKAVTS